jgi:Subtilase family
MPILMKIFLLNFIFLLRSFNVAAQVIGINKQDSCFLQYTQVSLTPGNLQLSVNTPFYLVFAKQKLATGYTVVRQLSNTAFIIKDPYSSKIGFSDSDFLLVTPANNLWKLSPAVCNKVNNLKKKQLHNFIVTGTSLTELVNLLGTQNVKVLQKDSSSASAVIQCTPAFVSGHLLNQAQVIFIDFYLTPSAEINAIGYKRFTNNISLLDYKIANANGKNVIVGIKEQNLDKDDIDLFKRTIPSTLASAVLNIHATTIATLVGGAGNSYYDGRGIAHACKFYSSSFANLFADNATILNQNSVSLQNHSYGTVVQQFYGAEALSYDAQLWQNKNMLHIFSSGNSGESAPTDGPYQGIAGYANLTANFKMAKNVISVGAVTDLSKFISFSSAGPAYDGRLAPQLVALGANGTSDAAALVSGTAAVMQQVYKDSNMQQLPPASLIKAILYNTAGEVHTPGIDYKTGYGLLNAYEAVKSLQQKKYTGGTVSATQPWVNTIHLSANIDRLKVTLTWTDTAATVNNNKALINDLDLEIKELTSGIVYKPWVLNSTASIDSLLQLPKRKRDSLNTAEQISIDLPNAGLYEIKVIGFNVVNGTIPFSVAINADTLNTFSFINPVHTSDVQKYEEDTLTIRWTTKTTNINATGSLSITYNDGNTWNVISPDVNLSNQMYRWYIKDTASAARLKMETAFGNFESNNFIISDKFRLNLDYNCTDSFRLSWTKYIFANNYKIYALKDSSHLELITATTDTFKVFQKAQFPFTNYAVEPVLTNNISAAFSGSYAINLLQTKCYYTALNYNIADINALQLNLTLSFPDNVQTVQFEAVTSAGQLLNGQPAQNVTNNERIYYSDNFMLQKGVNYFRAKITLVTGQVIYTDIVSASSTGEDKILFYPNPVTRSTPLNYLLKDNFGTNFKLLLYNTSGQLLSTAQITAAGTIDVSSLPLGVIIYKVISEDNVLFTEGKFIILN